MFIKILTFILLIQVSTLFNAQQSNSNFFFAHSIEEAMKDPKNVSGIRLESLNSLPTELIEFTNLELIILFECAIDSIPIRFNMLKNIKEVHLTGCSLFPEGFEAFSNVEKIVLSGNSFKEIPKNVEHLFRLKSLKVDNLYNSGVIPKELSNFKHIEVLNIAFVETPSIIEAFGTLNNLKEIIILKSNVACLHPEKWPNIKRIVLKENQLDLRCIEDLLKLNCKVEIEQNGKEWRNDH